MRPLQKLALVVSLAGIANAAKYLGPWSITDSWERTLFGSWFTRDGALFYAYKSQQPNGGPDHSRFWALRHEDGDRLYTTDETEKDLAKPSKENYCHESPYCKACDCKGWHLEDDEVIWVWTKEGDGRVPLHRFNSGKYHFFSRGREEGDDRGYTYEGVAAWVLPGPSEGAVRFDRYHLRED